MLEIKASIAARNFDATLSLEPGETVAIMGPNGAGKSTLIQVLSGLVKPDAGHATLGGRELFRLGSGGSWLPPHERGIGVLAQEPLLFPHLNVLDNVAFGPRSQGQNKASAAKHALHWLGEVDALELSSRKPAQLSGGQAQRVALARVLATNPDLLLLDEPMAALDVNTAPFLRSLLRRVLAGRSAIIVTHDVLDALMLADRVIIMEDGHIMEFGPTAAVLAHPRSAFAASLAGLNVLPGILSGSTVVMTNSAVVTGRLAGGLAGGIASESPATTGVNGLAAFPPSAVSVFLSPPQGSPRNCFAVTVTELEPHAGYIRLKAGRFAADISPAAAADLALEPGSEVFFVVKAAEVIIYPA